MSPTKLLVAAALVVAGTSASMAQGWGYDSPLASGYTYDYVPGNYDAPYNGPGYFENDSQRGGPGPRVQSGAGMGIGGVR